MPKIIKNGEIVDDIWQHLDDEASIPSSGAFSVSFARWLAEKDKLKQTEQDLAVRMTGDDNLQDIVSDLASFTMITLFFPQFTDGRGYSYARLLRERYGFTGEIRAQGDVGQDQLFFLAQCGFNSFELVENQKMEDALAALTVYSETYQSTVLNPEPLYKRR